MGSKKVEAKKLGNTGNEAALAILIDKGLACSRRKTKAKNELEKIKAEIRSKLRKKDGKWVTPNGALLCISKRAQFEEIDPVAALDFLKSKRRGPRFFECIKVMFEQFKQYADDTDIQRLRKKADSTLQFSFKQEPK